MFLPSVLALDVQPGQDHLDLTIPRGATTHFYLILTAPAQEQLTASSWITLEGGESFTLPSGGTVFVDVALHVPEDQDVGTTTQTISANGVELVTIDVTTTLSTEDINTLRTLADVNGQIAGLEGNVDGLLDEQFEKLKSQIQTIATSVHDVKEYVADVDELEAANAGLTSQVEHLEQERSTLEEERNTLEATGNLIRAESPFLFFLGVLIGAGGIYLFYRKLHKYL